MVRGSKNAALDHEAVEVLRRAEPYAAWKSKDYQLYQLVSKFSWEANKGAPEKRPAPPTEACAQDR